MSRSDAYQALRAHLERTAPDVMDRIAPERDLAAAIGCSRATLRTALERLEREGEVWRHVGKGTFRGARPRHLPIRDRAPIEGAAPHDLMEARLVLEPAVAAAAARVAGPEDIALLSARVADGRAGRDRAACEAADDAFHRTIASVAGNPVVIGMMTYLSGARRRIAWRRQWDRAYRRLGVDEFRFEHSDQHQAIVDAIARREPDTAAAAMRRHLEIIAEAMARDAPSS